MNGLRKRKKLSTVQLFTFTLNNARKNYATMEIHLNLLPGIQDLLILVQHSIDSVHTASP